MSGKRERKAVEKFEPEVHVPKKRPKTAKAKKSTAKKEGTKKSKKADKADKPKRGKSSFMFFSIEIRPKVVEEFPELTFGGVGKHIGAEWKKLNDKAKKKYEDLSAKDKKAAAAANKKAGL